MMVRNIGMSHSPHKKQIRASTVCFLLQFSCSLSGTASSAGARSRGAKVGAIAPVVHGAYPSPGRDAGITFRAGPTAPDYLRPIPRGAPGKRWHAAIH